MNKEKNDKSWFLQGITTEICGAGILTFIGWAISRSWVVAILFGICGFAVATLFLFLRFLQKAKLAPPAAARNPLTRQFPAPALDLPDVIAEASHSSRSLIEWTISKVTGNNETVTNWMQTLLRRVMIEELPVKDAVEGLLNDNPILSPLKARGIWIDARRKFVAVARHSGEQADVATEVSRVAQTRIRKMVEQLNQLPDYEQSN